jgi:DNA repair protein RadC
MKNDNNNYVMDSPKSVLYYLNFFDYQQIETLFLITIDEQLQLINCHKIKSGHNNIDLIHPREVIIPALSDQAKGIILIHNHPSGKNIPSQNDHIFTKYIKKICELLNIALVDHLILGKNGVYSYKEAGTEIFPCAHYSPRKILYEPTMN